MIASEDIFVRKLRQLPMPEFQKAIRVVLGMDYEQKESVLFRIVWRLPHAEISERMMIDETETRNLIRVGLQTIKQKLNL